MIKRASRKYVPDRKSKYLSRAARMYPKSSLRPQIVRAYVAMTADSASKSPFSKPDPRSTDKNHTTISTNTRRTSRPTPIMQNRRNPISKMIKSPVPSTNYALPMPDTARTCYKCRMY